MYWTNQRRAGQVFSRVILPLVLFVGMVGGMAWVIQYMPRSSKKPAPKPNDGQAVAPAEPLVKFERDQAVWDPNDPSYAKEFEKDMPGHYDFPFVNVSGGPLDLGLLQSNCDCQKIEVCVFTPAEWQQYQSESSQGSLDEPSSGEKNLQWKPLTSSETESIVVPAEGRGLARVNWKSSRQEGQRLSLQFRLWYQPQGQVALRQNQLLATAIVVVGPVMFRPERVHIGALVSQARATFIGWSATRSDPKLNTKQVDPCFVVHLQKYSPAECAALQENLKKEEINTRIKSAFQVNVTVNEERNGKHLDQGHFQHTMALVLDGEEFPGPVIQGVVRGDVEVGSSDEQGKIQFRSFPASLGKKRVVAISADAKTKLTLESFQPLYLKVKLDVNHKESTPSRTIWNLAVEVPPTSMYGSFPEDSSIILRSQNTQSRLIRIPISGIAVQD